MKKAFALALVVVMVFAMAMPTFADETVSLTIKGEMTGHTYEAYQIFDGTINANGVMTDIVWGSGIDATKIDALMTALKSDATIGSDLSATTAESVANAMKAWGDNGAKIDAFAALLKDYLDETKAYTSTANGIDYTFATLDPGYYLIKDKDGTVDDKHDFYTKFIIDVTTSTDIAVKGSVPTVTKKVSSTLDGNYTEQITNQLNKTHYYEWTGTIPSDIHDYDFYYYEFVDTLSAGLTFLRFEEIYFETSTGKDWIYNAALDNPIVEPRWYPGDATIGAIDATVNHAGGDHTIGIKWNDLKSVYGALATSDKIVVKYSAKLNENAVIGGTGNPNNVELIFSNNPHNEDDKGKTPPMDPRVYSFGLEVNKRAGTETGEALKGAQFVLYHNHTEHVTDPSTGGTTSVLVPMYAVVNAAGKITSWTEDINAASTLTTGADGKIKVEGLQQGMGYFLHEVKAPDGYNKLTNDVQITIESFTTDSNGEVTGIAYNVDSKLNTSSGDTAKAGLVTATVINKAGTTLPSTGGVGTTMFYALGGLMVAAALTLLVTKKRMGAQN